MNCVFMLNEWTYVECPLCGSDEQLPQCSVLCVRVVFRSPHRRGVPGQITCCQDVLLLPVPRGRGLGRAHRQSVWDRWRRWLRAPRGGLWPFARRNRKSFPPDVADEGDTPSTSPREGSEPHPPAREAQCRVQPRAPLPLRQHEDLEPSAAEHRALALTFKYNQAPLPRPVPTEVVAHTCAGPRDPLRGDLDLSLSPKTPVQLDTGQHTGQIGPLCLQDPQTQAPMSHPLSLNVHLHLHLHLLGLWQENPSQGMSYHLCRESLPWLLVNTQMPTMTDLLLQGERAPLLDRDPEPFLETPRPGAWLALQPPSLSAPCGRH
ncbi:uncharacterized protein LOC122422697 [Cervus canadensis]|uniref:uncharacterized protein LOC122422697 n=1 Tax=Cervus canadensis TaxID=1574408 RepID=UPI001CA36DB1|nr:uncharacterized protein LOC122422697 [Cervus canadensis]